MGGDRIEALEEEEDESEAVEGHVIFVEVPALPRR